MNKNAQITTGIILITFIGILIGAILLVPIADNIGTGVNTISYNTSANLGSPAITVGLNGTYLDLPGRELLSTPLVSNLTPPITILATNYTIDEGISATTGMKTIRFLVLDPNIESQTFNISYNYGADGYIDNAGGRAIALIIVIFAALGILVVALTPTLRSGVLEMVGR